MNIYGHTQNSPTMYAFMNSSVNIYLLSGREVNTEGSEIRLPVFKSYLLFLAWNLGKFVNNSEPKFICKRGQ